MCKGHEAFDQKTIHEQRGLLYMQFVYKQSEVAPLEEIRSRGVCFHGLDTLPSAILDQQSLAMT